MSHPGYGRPVDALDRICKEYRNCVRCSKDTHGDSCIPEFTKYRWNYKDCFQHTLTGVVLLVVD